MVVAINYWMPTLTVPIVNYGNRIITTISAIIYKAAIFTVTVVLRAIFFHHSPSFTACRSRSRISCLIVIPLVTAKILTWCQKLLSMSLSVYDAILSPPFYTLLTWFPIPPRLRFALPINIMIRRGSAAVCSPVPTIPILVPLIPFLWS